MQYRGSCGGVWMIRKPVLSINVFKWRFHRCFLSKVNLSKAFQMLISVMERKYVDLRNCKVKSTIARLWKLQAHVWLFLWSFILGKSHCTDSMRLILCIKSLAAWGNKVLYVSYVASSQEKNAVTFLLCIFELVPESSWALEREINSWTAVKSHPLT